MFGQRVRHLSKVQQRMEDLQDSYGYAYGVWNAWEKLIYSKNGLFPKAYYEATIRHVFM